MSLICISTAFVFAQTASSIGEGGIYYAAYSLKNGAMRIMQNSDDYHPKTEGVIDWNKQGPQGPAGTNGTNGISINWKGSLTSAQSITNVNDAYYNSTSGSYTYLSWHSGSGCYSRLQVTYLGPLPTP